MNEFLVTIILGIVQGLSEFLPISSSGHLEIAKYLLGDKSSGIESLELTIILHIATALSTVLVFRKEISKILQGLINPDDSESKSFSLKIIISMIPAVIVGLLYEDLINTLFEGKILFVSSMLLVTATLLFFAHYHKDKEGSLSYKNALIIGISQAIAITPGISRSGATIGTALLLNVNRAEAARFSFLMVIPLIFGKMSKDILSGELGVNTYSTGAMAAGFVAAFIAGIIACKWMIEIVKRIKLHYFAYYCVIVGSGMIIYLLFLE
ncbi:MAG: undecaprenyl-diphosphate phosphatase [Bacteroidota bacterium]|nr:undecaprenyl-diphosphate phosphatase [Bacteroidota bacterium]